MRHSLHAPDIEDSRVGKNGKVEEHALPARADVSVIVDGDEGLGLKTCSKRGRRGQDDLPANGNPARCP